MTRNAFSSQTTDENSIATMTGEVTIEIRHNPNRYWDVYDATLRLYSFLQRTEKDDRLFIKGVRPTNGRSLFMHGEHFRPHVAQEARLRMCQRRDCTLTATFDRQYGRSPEEPIVTSEDLEAPSLYETPEFEINADYYQRTPDLIGRIMLSSGCCTSARVISISTLR